MLFPNDPSKEYLRVYRAFICDVPRIPVYSCPSLASSKLLSVLQNPTQMLTPLTVYFIPRQTHFFLLSSFPLFYSFLSPSFFPHFLKNREYFQAVPVLSKVQGYPTMLWHMGPRNRTAHSILQLDSTITEALSEHGELCAGLDRPLGLWGPKGPLIRWLGLLWT